MAGGEELFWAQEHMYFLLNVGTRFVLWNSSYGHIVS
jgi:hypothetical protein